MHTAKQGKDTLNADLNSLVGDAEEMLDKSKNYSDEKFTEARKKFSRKLDSVKSSLNSAQRAAQEKYQAAAEATDEYVQDNPWKSVGVAAVVGIVIGLMSSSIRRS
jgi:ElaB/YqjD/DUF883 family membrane-anchored ribosome-binding protein